ncbi:hypothetical protein Taro_034192 [Colocasia esculenta]|uniref:Uncharacterized protein n=1 Tax=Colocasia esculenta TaxID=4460 RepID=A0A843W6V2_COLES|nr:hypothetical protein [Colocasia esculenta]
MVRLGAQMAVRTEQVDQFRETFQRAEEIDPVELAISIFLCVFFFLLSSVLEEVRILTCARNSGQRKCTVNNATRFTALPERNLGAGPEFSECDHLSIGSKCRF